MKDIQPLLKEFYSQYPELQEGAVTQALGAGAKALGQSLATSAKNTLAKVPLVGKAATNSMGMIGNAIQAGKQAYQQANAQQQDLANVGLDNAGIIQSAVTALKNYATVVVQKPAEQPAQEKQVTDVKGQTQDAQVTQTNADQVVEKVFRSEEYRKLQSLLEASKQDTVNNAIIEISKLLGDKTPQDIAKDATLFSKLQLVVKSAKQFGVKIPGLESIDDSTLQKAKEGLDAEAQQVAQGQPQQPAAVAQTQAAPQQASTEQAAPAETPEQQSALQKIIKQASIDVSNKKDTPEARVARKYGLLNRPK